MRSLTLDPRFKSDEVFNATNKYFITLKDDEMSQYSEKLRTVLDIFIEYMREDPLFNACYQRIAGVGSYYEGLKVGKPDEFDFNFIIKLPINYNDVTTKIDRQRPGYVKLKANPNVLPNLRKHNRWAEYRKMNNWFDENDYLDQNKFRNWFISVVTKAINLLPSGYGRPIADLSYTTSGPAWTLKIHVPRSYTISVDLVPVLEFSTPPPKPFINHKTTKQNWFAFAKPLKGRNNNISWRPSFYEREQEILKGNIKEVIRQMKKLRDTCGFKCIASYYIKTLFLRELEKHDRNFQRLPSTFLFFYMLQKLRDACTAGEMKDLWNPKENLLSNISLATLTNIRNRLDNIIRDIDKRIAKDPYVIAEYILTPDEFRTLKQSTLSSQMSSLRLSNNYIYM